MGNNQGSLGPIVTNHKNKGENNMDPLLKQTQKDVAKHYARKIDLAGLAELEAIDKKIERHYNNGTLSAEDFGKLSVRTMEEICRYPEHQEANQWGELD